VSSSPQAITPSTAGGPVGDPVLVTLGAWEELGAAIRAVDRKALTRFRGMLPQKLQLLRAAAQHNPQVAPMVHNVLVPTLQRTANVANSVAKNAALQRRVIDTANELETATHIIPVCFDSLADAGSNTATVSAPYNGQPWRFLSCFAASTAAVGTRLSKFSLATTNHVVTDNVTYGSAPTKPGIDFSILSGSNHMAALMPQHRWRPWGLKRSGVIRPDGKIDIGVENRSGGAASMFLGLMVQASPCGEQAQYQGTPGGVYRTSSKYSKQFFNNLVKFSMFR
jgi:hypothetical protein